MSQDEIHFVTTNQLHYKNLQSRQQKVCKKNENKSQKFAIYLIIEIIKFYFTSYKNINDISE